MKRPIRLIASSNRRTNRIFRHQHTLQGKIHVNFSVFFFHETCSRVLQCFAIGTATFLSCAFNFYTNLQCGYSWKLENLLRSKFVYCMKIKQKLFVFKTEINEIIQALCWFEAVLIDVAFTFFFLSLTIPTFILKRLSCLCSCTVYLFVFLFSQCAFSHRSH